VVSISAEASYPFPHQRTKVLPQLLATLSREEEQALS
jgi:hypothetical protein